MCVIYCICVISDVLFNSKRSSESFQGLLVVFCPIQLLFCAKIRLLPETEVFIESVERERKILRKSYPKYFRT